MNSHVAAYFLHLADLYDSQYFDVSYILSRSLSKSCRQYASDEMLRG